MQENKLYLLSTRPVSSSLVREAASKHIIIDIESFIETEPIQSVECQQEVEQAILQNATVVFTSMNAVEAVAAGLEGQEPDWQIYCMGNTTQQLAIQYFGEERIAGIANSAQELAEHIVRDGATEEVIFFCGNQRRDELPAILGGNQILVHEIVVYQTIPTPHIINKHYHGILFFSPSAVDSFFQMNKAQPQTIFFAIGATTAGVIRVFTDNKIIIGDEAIKDSLVQKAIDFFSGNE